MKHFNFFIMTIVLSSSLSFSVHAQSDKQMNKMQEKQYKDKFKELKKGGWTSSGVYTLEFALAKYYRALNSDADNNQEWIGKVANCRATCEDVALSNAQSTYAQQATAFIKKNIKGGKSDNESTEQLEENANFLATYEMLVCKEVSGLLKPYLSIERPNNSGGKEYQIWYIINEADASKARMRAMHQAFEEAKLAQGDADQIAKFVNERFPKDEK